MNRSLRFFSSGPLAFYPISGQTRNQTPMDTSLKKIRRGQGMSQRRLAHICGISRGRVRRLERVGFDAATCSEMKRISQALNLELAEFLIGGEDPANGIFHRKALGSFFDVVSFQAGCRIASYFPPLPGFFVGKLFLAAHKSLSSIPYPADGRIFLQVLLGQLRLKVGKKIFQTEEGDCLLFKRELFHSLENPLSRESVALLLIVP